MTKEYVLVFAHQVPCNIPHRVVLVEKAKPEWQVGKLNLPGGSIEPGESPEQAAERELLEETGLVACTTKTLGTINGPGWRIYVCFCCYRGTQQPQTTTDEEVSEMDYRVALTDERLIPNLKLVIPLCIAQVEGWKMRDTTGHNTWEVKGLCPTN